MKKFFLITFLATVCSAMAAQLPFDVQPPSWSLLAKSISDDGVNIRQSPSTNAARALVDWDKVDDYQASITDYMFWSKTAPHGNIQSYMFSGPAPIVGQQNGWLEISGIGPAGNNGWVYGKLCRQISPEPVTEAGNSDNLWMRFFKFDGADYAMVMEPNEMDGDINIWLGRLDNGFLICPYHLYINSYESAAKTALVKQDNDVYIYYTSPKDSDEYGTPYLRPVSGNVINDIISAMEQLTTPRIYFMYQNQITSI